jgi:membrane-bound lytic murein transglycosylase B
MKKFLNTFLLIAFFLLPSLQVFTAHAQNAGVCDDNFAGLSQDELRQKLAICQAELAEQEKVLEGQKKQSGTLKGDISVLASDISAKQTKINARILLIKKLGGEIVDKNKKISQLSDRLDDQKESLAQLIRKTKELDENGFVDLVLGADTLSEFYRDADSFASIKGSLKKSVDTLNGIKTETEEEKQSLEEKKDAEADAKAEIEAAKKKVEQDKAAHQKLLSISQNKEKEYQKVIAAQKAKVNAINARLFTLAGQSQAIRFDAALAYAESASAKTGVDPAFLLAIITNESNLGANVGKCYLTDTNTGAGVGVNTGKSFSNLMKPSRDVTPFLEITKRIGYDWGKTVVSCPIAGVAGYGGAMGPAQFIPSTWKIFEARLKSALGHDANPWMAEDAFMASAMYLTDLGAVGNSYSSQIKAACKYYGTGGSSCSYGKRVMGLKTGIQEDIDYLKQYGVSNR